LRYNQLGQTGLFVSELCLGAMTFGGRGFFKDIGQLGQPEADQLIRRALEAGINFIDTADVYSEGESERMTGQALKNLGVKRSSVVVATKVHGRVGPGPNETGSSRGHIMDSVHGSLERLQTDHIDLYQIHGHDVIAPVEETMRALEDLVRQGLVRYIGVSNWPAWRIMKAQGVAARYGWSRFETLQAYYTLTNRDLERELVPLMEDQSMGLMVWSPLAGGLLSGKFRRDAETPKGARRAVFDFPPVDRERLWRVLDVMRPIAEARGVSCARVAVAWLLSKPVVMTVILGAKTVEQMDDTIAASGLSLTKEELAKLDQVSELTVEYPVWMLQRTGVGRRPAPVGPDRG
jgi:aryl-alcohol dehydrogenase-like predicted oxidoreductase